MYQSKTPIQTVGSSGASWEKAFSPVAPLPKCRETLPKFPGAKGLLPICPGQTFGSVLRMFEDFYVKPPQPQTQAEGTQTWDRTSVWFMLLSEETKAKDYNGRGRQQWQAHKSKRCQGCSMVRLDNAVLVLPVLQVAIPCYSMHYRPMTSIMDAWSNVG